MILDSYLGAHKTILQYTFFCCNGSGDTCVGGRHGLWGFLEFRATHDFGANNVHNSILDLTKFELHVPYLFIMDSWDAFTNT